MCCLQTLYNRTGLAASPERTRARAAKKSPGAGKRASFKPDSRIAPRAVFVYTDDRGNTAYIHNSEQGHSAMKASHALVCLATCVLCFFCTPEGAEAARKKTAPPPAPKEAPAQEAPREDAPREVALSPQAAFALMAGNAEKGDPAAMLNLGRLYEYGHGAPRNFTKALSWYAKAADAGLAEGHYNVGVCYEIGMGATADPQKAVEHYRKAVEKKLPLALHKMSALYLNGIGVEKNEAKAMEYLNQAAAAGLPQAANDLGLICMQGLYGQQKSYNKALDWFIKGSDKGNLDSMANIAAFFDEGTPAKANPLKALKWYLILRKSGVKNELVDARAMALIKELPPAQAKTAEAEADAWLKSYRDRVRAE
jgi:TPR repeat protein